MYGDSNARIYSIWHADLRFTHLQTWVALACVLCLFCVVGATGTA